MFDVSWDDPNSETVAQHRQRKEREGRGSTHDSQDTSLKSVGSSDSLRPRKTQASPTIDKATNQRKPSIARGAISLLKNTNFISVERKASTPDRNTNVESQATVTNTSRVRSHDNQYQLRDSVADTVQSASQSKGTEYFRFKAMRYVLLWLIGVLQMSREIKKNCAFFV